METIDDQKPTTKLYVWEQETTTNTEQTYRSGNKRRQQTQNKAVGLGTKGDNKHRTNYAIIIGLLLAGQLV